MAKTNQVEKLTIILLLAILPATVAKNQKSIATAPSTNIEAKVTNYAKKYEIPSKLVHAIVYQESSYNPDAKRYEPKLKGYSRGLMQVMDTYFVNSKLCPNIKRASDLHNADKNLDCGLSILSNLLLVYPSTKDALIAYNGGHGCFKSKKCYSQASSYAEKILKKS